MLINSIAMSLIYVIQKDLIKVISSKQIAFLYKMGVFMVMIPVFLQEGISSTVATKKIHIHIARGAFSLMGSICFCEALNSINTVDATAMTYLENIVILFTGVLYFKEKLTRPKIILTISGLVGALLVTKPGNSSLNIGYVYILFAIFFWALNNFSIKILGKTERSKTQLFYASLFSSMLSIPMIYNKSWDGLQVYHYKYIFALSILHAIHVVSFFRALKSADISIVMPFDYTRIIFSGILGYFIFSERPDILSIIGYIIIMLGGGYMIYKETFKNNIASKSNEGAPAN